MPSDLLWITPRIRRTQDKYYVLESVICNRVYCNDSGGYHTAGGVISYRDRDDLITRQVDGIFLLLWMVAFGSGDFSNVHAGILDEVLSQLCIDKVQIMHYIECVLQQVMEKENEAKAVIAPTVQRSERTNP